MMNALRTLSGTIVLALAACGTPAARVEVATAARMNLAGTYWRLTQLGDEQIGSPPGSGEIHLQLQTDNPRVVGFSGCNRMFGAYVLQGAELRFHAVGGTKMACVDAGRMLLEQRYLDMFTSMARWDIAGSNLTLSGADGRPVAVFAGLDPKQSPPGTLP